MQTTVLADAQTVAEAAADWIAAEAKAAIAARGRFVMAVSGGKTPWLMSSTTTFAPPSVPALAQPPDCGLSPHRTDPFV